MNRLYYGDNLEILRDHIADASVDLIYLDPPFNSNAGYNILFKSPSGEGTDASIEAFDDTWEWGPTASMALNDIRASGNHKLHTLVQAMKTAIGENAMMAYLAMMAVRLVELHRVLKPTGSLYLHCDPTASHYLKLVLDAVFGVENFRTEIVWRRTTSRSNTTRSFADVTDTIFYYSKGRQFTFNMQFVPYSDEYLKLKYRHTDENGRVYRLSDLRNPGVRPNLTYDYKGFKPHPNGWAVSFEKMEQFDREGRLEFPKKPEGRIQIRRYLDERDGTQVPSLWDDIRPINSQAQERLGYPTQKPRALLERIIAASSNPGDTVLDPFCGCGTAVDAAQLLGRNWIGIDITHLAIGLIEDRLTRGYNQDGRTDAVWETFGVPKDKASALKLAAENPHEFQNWFCLQVGGYPLDGGRKGADKGVDGHFYPYENRDETRTGVISVKAGRNIDVSMIRDLRGVMEREGYTYGLFLSAFEPTRPMQAEAASAGIHENIYGKFPRIQITTPADLFHGNRPHLPLLAPINRKAPRVETRTSHKKGAQGALKV